MDLVALAPLAAELIHLVGSAGFSRREKNKKKSLPFSVQGKCRPIVCVCIVANTNGVDRWANKPSVPDSRDSEEGDRDDEIDWCVASARLPICGCLADPRRVRPYGVRFGRPIGACPRHMDPLAHRNAPREEAKKKSAKRGLRDAELLRCFVRISRVARHT